MSLRNDLARHQHEVRVEFAAPRAVFEGLALPCGPLDGSDVFSRLEIAGMVAMVYGVKDLSLAFRAAFSTALICATQLLASATALFRGQSFPPSEMKSL